MAPPLEPCPDSPNCVSSLASDSAHFVEPFDSHGDAADAICRLRSVIKALPRTKIESQTDTHLHATFRTRIMRFVDDVEFMVDLGVSPAVIHVRSASRLGYSDFGVNRKRIVQLRAAFEATYAAGPDGGGSG